MTDKEIKIGTIIISRGASFTTKHLEEISSQFKRLEAENKELKALLNKRDESVTAQTEIILNLKAENAKLKEEVKAETEQAQKWYQLETDKHLLAIKYFAILEKIKEIAETKTMPSCLKPDCNCDICQDEITEYGQKCIRNGLRQILRLINESEG